MIGDEVQTGYINESPDFGDHPGRLKENIHKETTPRVNPAALQHVMAQWRIKQLRRPRERSYWERNKTSCAWHPGSLERRVFQKGSACVK